MWENMVDDGQYLCWLADALINGNTVLVIDGSFDKMQALMDIRAGGLSPTRRPGSSFRGSFTRFPGRRVHTVANFSDWLQYILALALVKFYGLTGAWGKLCCDNINALFQLEKDCQCVRTGAKQVDLLRALRTLKCHQHQLLHFTYEHIQSQKDRHKLWHQLSL